MSEKLKDRAARCVTHHAACDCREYAYREQIKRLEEALRKCKKEFEMLRTGTDWNAAGDRCCQTGIRIVDEALADDAVGGDVQAAWERLIAGDASDTDRQLIGQSALEVLDDAPPANDALERLRDGRDVPMPQSKEHAEALVTVGLRWLEDGGHRNGNDARGEALEAVYLHADGDDFGTDAAITIKRAQNEIDRLRTALEQAEEALADMKVCESCERTVGQEVPETMICTRCHNNLARRMEQAERQRDEVYTDLNDRIAELISERDEARGWTRDFRLHLLDCKEILAESAETTTHPQYGLCKNSHQVKIDEINMSLEEYDEYLRSEGD